LSGPRGYWFIPKVRDRADTGDGDIAFPGPGNSFFDHQGLLLGGQAKAAKLLGGVPGLLIPTVKGCPWIPAGLVGSPPFYPLFCTIRAGSPRFWGLPGQGRCLGDPSGKNTRLPISPCSSHVFTDPRAHGGASWIPDVRGAAYACSAVPCVV